MLKWSNFNYYNRTYYNLIEKTKTLYLSFCLLGFSTRRIKSDFLFSGTAEIYPYSISRCLSSFPVQKLDIARHSECLENIIKNLTNFTNGLCLS